MRKLTEEGTENLTAATKEPPSAVSASKTTSDAVQKNKTPYGRAVKVTGYALFCVGLALLYAILYIFRETPKEAYFSAITASLDIAAGFILIKFAYSEKYRPLTAIVAGGCLGALGLMLLSAPFLLKLPIIASLLVLVVSLLCQVAADKKSRRV